MHNQRRQWTISRIWHKAKAKGNARSSYKRYLILKVNPMNDERMCCNVTETVSQSQNFETLKDLQRARRWLLAARTQARVIKNLQYTNCIRITWRATAHAHTNWRAKGLVVHRVRGRVRSGAQYKKYQKRRSWENGLERGSHTIDTPALFYV